MTDQTPKIVIARMVYWLQKQLGLSAVTCYSSAASAYIDGQPPFVLQVCPGGVGKAEGGDGGQEGGVLFRRQSFIVALFQTALSDMPGRTEDALIRTGQSILDKMETIRQAFEFTCLGNSLRVGDFGGLLYEPMRFESESLTTWAEADVSVLTRQIVFSGKWGVIQPSVMSPVEADFTGMP